MTVSGGPTVVIGALPDRPARAKLKSEPPDASR
jgi:hypothetical protein